MSKKVKLTINFVEKQQNDGIQINLYAKKLSKNKNDFMHSFLITDPEKIRPFNQRLFMMSFYERFSLLKIIEEMDIFKTVHLSSCKNISFHQISILADNFDLLIEGDPSEFKALAKIEGFEYNENPDKLKVIIHAGDYEGDERVFNLNNFVSDRLVLNFVMQEIMSNSGLSLEEKLRLLYLQDSFSRIIEIINLMDETDNEEINILVKNGFDAFVLNKALNNLRHKIFDVKTNIEDLGIKTCLEMDAVSERFVRKPKPVVSGSGLQRLIDKYSTK
jgi:hypothetical protein